MENRYRNGPRGSFGVLFWYTITLDCIYILYIYIYILLILSQYMVYAFCPCFSRNIGESGTHKENTKKYMSVPPWCVYPKRQWNTSLFFSRRQYSYFEFSIFARKLIGVLHYNDVIMGAIASKITSLTIIFSTV